MRPSPRPDKTKSRYGDIIALDPAQFDMGTPMGRRRTIRKVGIPSVRPRRANGKSARSRR